MNGTAGEKSADSPSSETGNRSPEDIRQEIKDKKEAIVETLNRLDQSVQRATDWRAQAGDHPFLALGLAVSAGVLLSGIFKRKPGPRERMMDALAEGIEDLSNQVSDRIDSQLNRSAPGGGLKAIAAMFATKAAAAYLNTRGSGAAEKRNSPLNRLIQ